jgi:hypothetical protein
MQPELLPCPGCGEVDNLVVYSHVGVAFVMHDGCPKTLSNYSKGPEVVRPLFGKLAELGQVESEARNQWNAMPRLR